MMKTMRYRLLCASMLAGFCLSCTQQEVRTDDVFLVSVEQPSDPETRVYADENLMVLWHADDRVTVFNRSTYNEEYRFTGETGDNAGTLAKVDNGTQMTGKPRDYQLEKLESLIKEFRLEKVRKNTGDRLSGGERRRTEIARCLAIEPKFIMLDEPFAGVDPIAVEDIQQIVWQLKYRNIGILITDHNVHETLNITDRAYLLFEGRILFKGSPEELAVNPIVKEKYLGSNFVLQKKDFAKLEEQRRQKWMMEEEEQNY